MVFHAATWWFTSNPKDDSPDKRQDTPIFIWFSAPNHPVWAPKPHYTLLVTAVQQQCAVPVPWLMYYTRRLTWHQPSVQFSWLKNIYFLCSGGSRASGVTGWETQPGPQPDIISAQTWSCFIRPDHMSSSLFMDKTLIKTSIIKDISVTDLMQMSQWCKF